MKSLTWGVVVLNKVVGTNILPNDYIGLNQQSDVGLALAKENFPINGISFELAQSCLKQLKEDISSLLG